MIYFLSVIESEEPSSYYYLLFKVERTEDRCRLLACKTQKILRYTSFILKERFMPTHCTKL